MSDENDPSITDDVVFWRRVIKNYVVDDGAGGTRISSQAFQNASQSSHDEKMVPNGHNHSPAMSVNFAEKTTVQEFLGDDSSNLIVSFTAEFARGLNQGVLATPLPDDPAHASITGKKTKGVKRKFGEGCLLVELH